MSEPTIAEVAAYWAGRWIPGTDYVPCIDRGEPDCFACGAWGKYDAQAWGRDHSWERGISLDRAHVIPKSLGGSDDDPANRVLLCHECHLAAPDTIDPRYMWKWLAGHPRTGDHTELFFTSSFREAVKSYTGPGREMLKALATFSDEQLKVALGCLEGEGVSSILGFGAHFGRGPIVSAATWEAVLTDLYCRAQGQLFLTP
jgi:hypothetical protein